MNTKKSNITKTGNLWVVRNPGSGQEYSCISEEQAHHLDAVLNPGPHGR